MAEVAVAVVVVEEEEAAASPAPQVMAMAAEDTAILPAASLLGGKPPSDLSSLFLMHTLGVVQPRICRRE